MKKAKKNGPQLVSEVKCECCRKKFKPDWSKMHLYLTVYSDQLGTLPPVSWSRTVGGMLKARRRSLKEAEAIVARIGTKAVASVYMQFCSLACMRKIVSKLGSVLKKYNLAHGKSKLLYNASVNVKTGDPLDLARVLGVE